jgi:amino acid adenylation domain-containing protein
MQINILEYIEKTVPGLPDKQAFIGEDGAVTFREMYDRARAVGSRICRQGIYKRPVAVFMEKSAAMVTAFLGVVYGGCYYVPLDAEMPAFRVKLILETVAPPLIICDGGTRDIITGLGYGGQALLYDDAAITEINDAALAGIRRRAIDADPVYVVFTSGSTGMPKGVAANHRAVIDYTEGLTDVMGFSGETVFGMQVPLYVDACLKEIFPTLKCGATTYLIPKPLFMFPVKLIEYIVTRKINTVCWVVSAFTIVSGFGALEKAIPHTLHTIAFGSEVFPVKQFNKWRQALPQADFVHLYGPTEATGMSAYFKIESDYETGDTIPIGKPFRNTEIILLTDDGKTPAVGETGEICIRGAGLSPGYYKDAEKTQSAFVQNPLSVFPDIIYKTGDIGRYNENGELVFISRRDHQIKHLGHRIELAEIEWAAAMCESVRMACAVYDDEKNRIILYFVAEPGTTGAALSAYCKRTLPRYMLPYACLPLDDMPLTANGKADRVGLLERYRAQCRDAATNF